jgi:hypothetical protein
MDFTWMMLLILALGYVVNELLKWLGDRVEGRKIRREMKELNRDRRERDGGA